MNLISMLLKQSPSDVPSDIITPNEPSPLRFIFIGFIIGIVLTTLTAIIIKKLIKKENKQNNNKTNKE